MIWEKLGMIYRASGEYGWNKQGAFLPVTYLMRDTIRIYCSMHDENNIGRIGYVDVSAEDPTNIIKVSRRPVLDIGEPGCFDDNGVTPASLYKMPNDTLALYYIGWQLGVKVRYYLFSGVAVSTDGGETFTRVSKVPILDRVSSQICLRTAPSIFNHNGTYFLFYVGGSNWIDLNDKKVPTYNMYVASSKYYRFDFGEGHMIMKPNGDNNEFGFGRPQVIREARRTKMFYSIRYLDKGYRLGYAEYNNDRGWERKDNLMNLDVSDSGWDSATISFGHVIDYEDKRYIFYNGTSGQAGHLADLGCAILKED